MVGRGRGFHQLVRQHLPGDQRRLAPWQSNAFCYSRRAVGIQLNQIYMGFSTSISSVLLPKVTKIATDVDSDEIIISLENENNDINKKKGVRTKMKAKAIVLDKISIK